MKLITELMEDNEYLIESPANGPKKYFIEGNWISMDAKNKNGRIYPSEVVMSALDKYLTEYVKPNRALGELNHPADVRINLDRVSHVVKNLSPVNKFVVGRAEILDTPMGKIAKNLIDANVKLGVSTRGLGSVKAINGVNHVQNDFWMSAIDIVSDPSGKDCWVNGIMEGIEYMRLDDGRIVEMASEVIVDAHKKTINEDTLIKQFQRVMMEIANAKR